MGRWEISTNVPVDLGAERFGHELATIGLIKPTVLTADFAVYEDLPVSGLLPGSDASAAPRLLPIATVFERGLVAHVLDTIDLEHIFIALNLGSGEPVALAMKPGGLPWQQFARQRLMAIGRELQVDDSWGCFIGLQPAHPRRARRAHARRSPLWEDLHYGCLGDLAVQRMKAAA